MWETVESLTKPLRFISLVTTGVLAGLLSDFMFFITPALATLPASSFTETTKAIDKQFFEPIPWVYFVVNLSTFLVLVVSLRHWRSRAWILTAIAFLCCVAGTVSTVLYNVPINIDVINNWIVQTPPANWADIRDVWDKANDFRAVMFVAAFVLGVVTVLWPVRAAAEARQAAFGRVQPAH